MLMILLLAALSAYAIGASFSALRNDGYRRVPTNPALAH
jgi:hypothetical protein